MERRIAERKSIEGVRFSELTALDDYNMIADTGVIIDASPSGFLVQIERGNIVQRDLKVTLSLETLIGRPVALFLPQMNLDLDGHITRAKHLGKGTFEIAIQFSMEVPEYWRECLVDLLPDPGEFEY
ncbi:MAG: hypothetical protein HOO06_13155 [Bdellovibrionaceae bacterium]|jgi:hypothetical protein|nr:hypothetical protein [Pseudobdellovibrionaceae bacterium]